MKENVLHNNIILVDKNDVQIGTTDKTAAHKDALLHRAFSVFIFRKNQYGDIELLLQQRNPEKYHCGGLWTNTCCSHPQPGEQTADAALRRLQEECAFQTELTYAGHFIYQAKFDNGLTEHEYDHVFIGWYDDDINQFNLEEISQMCWITLDNLQKKLLSQPEKFTPWLAKALEVASTSS